MTSADEAESAALCPICGDQLAWHEQACLPASEPALVTETAEEKPVAQLPATATTFAYELGHRVQPAPAVTAQVI